MATYEEVKEVPNHPDVYLFDVRSKDEVANTGSIPASINIPLPELENALRMPEEDFKNKYKRDKPSKHSVIIFSCLKGGRAQRGTDLALSYGYKRAKTYHGSWDEWSRKRHL
uniref:Rhodanese domain-containing protein n=1 Tax=Glossina brevipalpis TaxID=37001 RepID=A0A1A9W5T8_9MUSC